MKEYLFRWVAYRDDDSLSKFNLFIFVLILLSIVLIVLESIVSIKSMHSSILKSTNQIIMSIFVIEYIIRLYISDLTHPSDSRLKSIFKFVFSLYGIIDLLSIIPFLLPFFVVLDLRFLRILRLFKFFKVLKLKSLNESLTLLKKIIIDKKPELISAIVITFFLIFLSGFMMYYIENPSQPEVFSNILISLWWAVATLTTVGYGDIYPITSLGILFSSIISLLGIGIVALPTGIIGAGYLEEMRKRKPKKPHYKNKTTIELTKNESIVLFDFLSRFNDNLSKEFIEDQAEERVLYDLECMLEKHLVEPSKSEYNEIVKNARNEVRDSLE